MLYRFGKFDTQVSGLLQEAAAKTTALAETPVDEILTVIDRVGKLWLPDGRYFQRALQEVTDEISFSPAMIEQTLRVIPMLCDKASLTRRLAIEFGNPDVLDRFSDRPGYAGRVRAVPYGTLLHVAAGNVFIGCIDSLINGFVTKNVSIMKLSGKNQRFPMLFAESVLEADPASILADKFALVYWPGGKSEIEEALKSQGTGNGAWGGRVMNKFSAKNLEPGTGLIENGPKISLQVIFKSGETSGLAQKIAPDLSLSDQSACSSPQNLFIQDGIELNELMKAIGSALDEIPWERGKLSSDEHVEILKERHRGVYHELMTEGATLEGKDWLITFDPSPGLRSSPLNRTLIMKRFKTVKDLGEQVSAYSRFLQTCGYLANADDRAELLKQGALWGLSRFAPIGQMMTGLEGSTHDGRYGWAELTRLISDEAPADAKSSEIDETLLSFVNQAIKDVPAYHQLYQGRKLKSLSELQAVSSSFFSEHPLTQSNALLRANADPGYIFSSGGTSGNPKFAYYSYEEFDDVGKMLSQGFRAQGIERGTLCANLFVAGNLWSSFLAVDQALKHCGARILPIGGNADPDLILKYLADFKPQFVVGLPSLLISLLHRASELGIELEVPQICYAGEHLNIQARKLFEAKWKTRRFSSAGYASVDAGPIGYQCASCGPGEHHLFSKYVRLSLQNDEAVVTSLVRKNMPVIHLRTGDQISWSPSETQCACGTDDPKFVLHGRCDGQMNLWSCRVQLSEVETALFQAGVKEGTYQIQIEELLHDGALLERMTIDIETDRFSGAKNLYESLSPVFGHQLHRLSKDVHATHPASYIQKRVLLRSVAPGALPRVARTGKLPRIRDLRKL